MNKIISDKKNGKTIGTEKAPKPIRLSLNGLLREFQRCSNMYLPIFHELFMPTCELAGHSVKAVCQSFRNSYRDQFDESWDDWHGPRNVRWFGRFFGDGEGLFEFEQLAESAFLVLREIQPSLPDDGYCGWIDILYEMAHGYPTPLLRCTLDRWNDKAIKDSSGDEPDSFATPESDGTPYPLYPLHLALIHNVFTSSIAAIELILDDEDALLVGDWVGGFPVSFPQQKDDSLPSGNVLKADQLESLRDETLKGPVKAFAFLEEFQRWYLEFDLGNESKTVTFDNREGCDIYNVLFRHPNEWLSASKLLQLTGRADTPTVEQEAASETKWSDQSRLDRTTIRQLKKRIASIEQELPKTVNSERRQELETERSAIEKELRVSTDFRGQSRPLGSDNEVASVKLVQTQLIRCRKHIAKELPEFSGFDNKCLRRQSGQWIYEPERWSSPSPLFVSNGEIHHV